MKEGKIWCIRKKVFREWAEASYGVDFKLM